ncbi:putative mitochondrial import receptor subunit tom7 [Tilletiopsis washingtonensis]|uniref:Putative mitochondrial import receptor subunit tom7 n=1 Tax=Tilletiopsis washingtonensis TaxID=58919 RepID=A0A316ZBI9_9BASI|nr:putative mitochondrial import receptor subunit tom7 [Tilletiopsis washingtonensis]PWN98292.1 putative mitochondrial import receptor subunit tom7 [Tilletiopsis washingtonensis]
MAAALSEDTKERIVRAIDLGKNVLHYGWVPFVLYIGYTQGGRPSLIQLVSPLA